MYGTMSHQLSVSRAPQKASYVVSLSVVKASEVVPLCYSLPAQFQTLLNAADASNKKARWIFKPLEPTKPNMLLEPTKMRDFNKIQK